MNKTHADVETLLTKSFRYRGMLTSEDGKHIGGGTISYMVKPDQAKLKRDMAKQLVAWFGPRKGMTMKIEVERDPSVQKKAKGKKHEG